MRRVLALLALALAASGCGAAADEPYTLEKTRKCLERAQGFEVRGEPRDDLIATAATGGSLRAFVPGNNVTIAVGETEQEARNMVRGYRQFSKRRSIRDILSRHRNAVVLWVVSPTPAQQQTVVGCLK